MSEALELLAKFRSDFPYYAHRALKIRSKDGTIIPLRFNQAQMKIHQAIENQRKVTGKVRAIIVKARQQGASTYIEARYYWKTSGEFGKQAFILTHEDKATQKIFAMAKRYHENCPAVLKPSTKFDNANTLYFDVLDSGYEVATARTKAVGRGGTFQYFHGSEAAFWPNAEDHMMGIGQAIPDARGTEIILESTGNGIGNLFHQKAMDALQDKGEYILIFVPWFIQEEYRKAVPVGFMLNDEEDKYRRAHKLHLEQIVWRRMKIVDDFNSSVSRFQQEYPATLDEAFIVLGGNSFIDADRVRTASTLETEPERVGALIVGVDPARSLTRDATGVIRRRGRVMYKAERHHVKDLMKVVGIVVNIIKDERPDKVFIDVGGIGAGVVDRLIELGYSDTVEGVNFGGRAIMDDRYPNRRVEMWSTMNDWLGMEPVKIPNDPILIGDLVGPQLEGHDSLGRPILESKQDMLEKRKIKSPDLGDAAALTFAFPVHSKEKNSDEWRKSRLNAARKKLPMAA